MTLSVHDIAAAVAGDTDDLPLIIERVRHWTREGLLQLVGEQNPGTGRKREYAGESLGFAKVLNALAELGVGVGKAKQFNYGMFGTCSALVKHAAANIAQNNADGITVYLTINRGKKLGKNPMVFLSEAMDIDFTDGKIIYAKTPARHRPELHPNTESAIVINLNELLL